MLLVIQGLKFSCPNFSSTLFGSLSPFHFSHGQIICWELKACKSDMKEDLDEEDRRKI